MGNSKVDIKSFLALIVTSIALDEIALSIYPAGIQTTVYGVQRSTTHLSANSTFRDNMLRVLKQARPSEVPVDWVSGDI